MHAGAPPVRSSQTTCSMVVHITRGALPTAWVTGTSAPCTSVFKPLWPRDSTAECTGPRPPPQRGRAMYDGGASVRRSFLNGWRQFLWLCVWVWVCVGVWGGGGPALLVHWSLRPCVSMGACSCGGRTRCCTAT